MWDGIVDLGDIMVLVCKCGFFVEVLNCELKELNVFVVGSDWFVLIDYIVV